MAASNETGAARERGCVVWLTGLPSAGKSTLAARARDRVRQEGGCCVLLDGDAVREVLVPRPGYSPEEREAFYGTLAGLAGLLAEGGAIVIVAATAHRRAFRERARAAAPRFIEVFVDVDADECARRDAKGLFAAARAGEVQSLPGAGAGYERPEHPEVVARGGHDQAALSAIVERIDREMRSPR
jgi:adenylylsulfate kinase